MSGARIRIIGGRVVDPANGVDRIDDLSIADGKIVSLGARPEGFQADHQIDASGLIVCPGFVDLCGRVREPGQEHKATIASESTAAAAGGITTLCCPPDTSPVIDTPAVVQLITERAEQAGKTRILPVGALTRNLNGIDLSEMHALRRAGCLAVGNADRPMANALVLRRALEYAANHGLIVLFRPEDPWLRGQGCVHEGEMSVRLGLPGIPAIAETVAVAQALPIIELTGVRAHFGQLSTVRSVEMVVEARSRGIPVTADVSIHHLHLTETDVEGFDPMCHNRPPFRTSADREGLRRALAEGWIDAVCSDHQPHEPDAKLDVFPLTQPGLSAFEVVLPLMCDLVAQEVMSLPDAIACLTAGPAQILGMPLGTLSPGAVADVCLFDPTASWSVSEDNWRSRGRNTPFWGKELVGRVIWTLLKGAIVHSAPRSL
jgi:dihydroorotase